MNKKILAFIYNRKKGKFLILKTNQNTKISKPLPTKFLKSEIKKSDFIISPWCCLTNLGVYNDYEYKYFPISKKLRSILEEGKKFSFQNIKDKEVREEIIDLFHKGIFVNKR